MNLREKDKMKKNNKIVYHIVKRENIGLRDLLYEGRFFCDAYVIFFFVLFLQLIYIQLLIIFGVLNSFKALEDNKKI